MVKRGKANIPKYQQRIWLQVSEMSFIIELVKPYLSMVAPNTFISEIVSFVLSDKVILEKFMKGFVEKHNQEIIELKIDVPKVIVEHIETIKIMDCPYCFIGFKSLKELKQHIEERHSKKEDVMR